MAPGNRGYREPFHFDVCRCEMRGGHRSQADDLVGATVNSVNTHYTRCAERLMVISQGVRAQKRDSKWIIVSENSGVR